MSKKGPETTSQRRPILSHTKLRRAEEKKKKIQLIPNRGGLGELGQGESTPEHRAAE